MGRKGYEVPALVPNLPIMEGTKWQELAHDGNNSQLLQGR